MNKAKLVGLFLSAALEIIVASSCGPNVSASLNEALSKKSISQAEYVYSDPEMIKYLEDDLVSGNLRYDSIEQFEPSHQRIITFKDESGVEISLSDGRYNVLLQNGVYQKLGSNAVHLIYSPTFMQEGYDECQLKVPSSPSVDAAVDAIFNSAHFPNLNGNFINSASGKVDTNLTLQLVLASTSDCL